MSYFLFFAKDSGIIIQKINEKVRYCTVSVFLHFFSVASYAIRT